MVSRPGQASQDPEGAFGRAAVPTSPSTPTIARPTAGLATCIRRGPAGPRWPWHLVRAKPTPTPLRAPGATPCEGVRLACADRSKRFRRVRRASALRKLDVPEPSTRTAVSPGHRLSRSGSPTSTRAGMRMARHGKRPRRRAVRPRVGRGTSRRLFNPGRVEGTRLPAGISLTSCLPGLCFTSSPPGSFLQRRRPPAYRAPPARPAATRNRARRTSALLPGGTSL